MTDMAPPPAFPNLSTLWGTIFAHTLRRLGATRAVVSPGSRCTPLLYALAADPGWQVTPVLDERTAAFYALGLAKAMHRPVVLVCTSGTAAANYLPAVVEAWHSGIPLLVVTADRPPELHDCGAGQTIDQHRLYGSHVVADFSSAPPDPAPETLAAWQDLLRTAWEKTTSPRPGPVHLNVPLRDPLAPSIRQDNFLAPLLEKILAREFPPPTVPGKISSAPLLDWASRFSRGLIVAGVPHPEDSAAHAQAVLELSRRLGWPVLADALSPLRHHAPADAPVIWAYDALLRRPQFSSALRPDAVLQIGPLPTSKTLRAWLSEPVIPFCVLSPLGANLHPLGQPHQTLRGAPEQISFAAATEADSFWCRQWQEAESAVAPAISSALAAEAALFEGKIIHHLHAHLPAQTTVILANSMPVRDAESFWPANNSQRRVFSSRGANGIDGTLGTALGIAQASNCPAVLLTGDLSFLHDSNALLLAKDFSGSLTVLLVNNEGGGIFQHLPVAQNNPHFERFWATPQHINFSHLAAAHGITHQKITDWPALAKLLATPPVPGIFLCEIPTHRASDAARRAELLRPE